MTLCDCKKKKRNWLFCCLAKNKKKTQQVTIPVGRGVCHVGRAIWKTQGQKNKIKQLNVVIFCCCYIRVGLHVGRGVGIHSPKRRINFSLSSISNCINHINNKNNKNNNDNNNTDKNAHYHQLCMCFSHLTYLYQTQFAILPIKILSTSSSFFCCFQQIQKDSCKCYEMSDYKRSRKTPTTPDTSNCDLRCKQTKWTNKKNWNW